MVCSLVGDIHCMHRDGVMVGLKPPPLLYANSVGSLPPSFSLSEVDPRAAARVSPKALIAALAIYEFWARGEEPSHLRVVPPGQRSRAVECLEKVFVMLRVSLLA